MTKKKITYTIYSNIHTVTHKHTQMRWTNQSVNNVRGGGKAKAKKILLKFYVREKLNLNKNAAQKFKQNENDEKQLV